MMMTYPQYIKPLSLEEPSAISISTILLHLNIMFTALNNSITSKGFSKLFILTNKALNNGMSKTFFLFFHITILVYNNKAIKQ